jgi:hypothetical protein
MSRQGMPTAVSYAVGSLVSHEAALGERGCVPDQREELGARLVAAAEAPQHGRRDGRSSGLLYPSHGHALMSIGVTSCVSIVRGDSGIETYVASITTATPRGATASLTAIAIWRVSRSCT